MSLGHLRFKFSNCFFYTLLIPKGTSIACKPSCSLENFCLIKKE